MISSRQTNDASVTGGARSDEDVMTRGIQGIENYVSQQVEGLGNKLMQRLWDAVSDPDKPQQFKFKMGGVDS